jgi:hypothetical protein
MSLTTRLGKGSGTPFKEMDQNLLYLESLSSGVLVSSDSGVRELAVHPIFWREWN